MLTIGITTFEHRYETYFKPLLRQIKQFDPHIEVIVAINGEHKQDFSNKYREDILDFISDSPNTYPIMFPTFRGLSKLWNSIIIHSSNDHILLLNDDVTIMGSQFIEAVKRLCTYNTSIEINGSWSHVLLNKKEVMEVGYFDERLLGIGQEEILIWEYEKYYKRKLESIYLPGIINHVDMSHAPQNIKATESGKYSKFNKDILFNTLYNINYDKGEIHGKIQEPLIICEPIIRQYPYESFYLENKDKL